MIAEHCVGPGTVTHVYTENRKPRTENREPLSNVHAITKNGAHHHLHVKPVCVTLPSGQGQAPVCAFDEVRLLSIGEIAES